MLIRINLPNNSDIKENMLALINILNEMDSCKENKMTLDFSGVSWMPPCCILLISNKVLELRQKRIEFEWIPSKKDKVTEHMKKLGFPLGTKVDGGSYVPITHVLRNNSDGKKLGKEINNLINKIIEKIPNNINGVSYILSELSDNIEDHSEYKCASIMAQYFPTKKEVEIIVFDDGLTIPGVFSKNSINFINDSESIKRAVSGEISTPKIAQKEIGRGYGLKTCKALSIEDFKGELYVFSKKGLVIFRHNQKNILENIKNPLNGTLICVRIKLPKEEIPFYNKVE